MSSSAWDALNDLSFDAFVKSDCQVKGHDWEYLSSNHRRCRREACLHHEEKMVWVTVDKYKENKRR